MGWAEDRLTDKQREALLETGLKAGKGVEQAGNALAKGIAETLRGRRGKYNAKPTEADGIRFASRKEAAFYSELKMQQEAGKITGFLMQVPFRFRSGIVYRADFLVFSPTGVRLIDVKGVETDTFKLKKRLMQDEFPWIELEVVK